MISGFIAKKASMTSIFNQEGQRIAVTKLIAQPLIVSDIIGKNVQVAYSKKHKKEFALTAETAPEKKSQITIDQVFQVGDNLSASGKSKGRGFAGVIKRHGFKKQPIKNSSDRVRAPGAVGAQTPSKIVKGKRMPGHYGNKTKTVLNLKVFSIDKDKNEIMIQGSLPGVINSWVVLKKL